MTRKSARQPWTVEGDGPHGYAFVYAPDRASWRSWLAANHDEATGVWLVYYKPPSGKGRVDYVDAVEEALCFGWIDSRANKLDEQRSAQLFTPRKPKSAWARTNKERFDSLSKQGLMTPAGLRSVEIAKANGAWTALDDVEDLIEPAELVAAFKKSKIARKNWDAFPRSAKRAILEWISTAKTETTRLKRVNETVERAAENVRANQPAPKK